MLGSETCFSSAKKMTIAGSVMQGQRHPESNTVKGLIAGLIGGLAASFVMNRFQASLSKSVEGVARSHGAQSLQQGAPRRGIARKLQKHGGDHEQEDATERFASAASEQMFDHKLTAHQKDIAGTANHYWFGILAGGVYGMAAEVLPRVTTGCGLTFGALVWLAADEGVTPALGLSKSTRHYPLRIHAYSITAHLVFGLTAEIARRMTRKSLSA